MPAPGGQEGDQAEGDGAADERVVDAQEGSVGEVTGKEGICEFGIDQQFGIMFL